MAESKQRCPCAGTHTEVCSLITTMRAIGDDAAPWQVLLQQFYRDNIETYAMQCAGRAMYDLPPVSEHEDVCQRFKRAYKLLAIAASNPSTAATVMTYEHMFTYEVATCEQLELDIKTYAKVRALLLSLWPYLNVNDSIVDSLNSARVSIAISELLKA